MDLNEIIKSLREGANLKRPAAVKLLQAQGVWINEEQLKRLEDGPQNKILTRAQDVLAAYFREGIIKPGTIELATLSHVYTMTLEDRMRRYIATNLPNCSLKKLTAMTQVMDEPDD